MLSLSGAVYFAENKVKESALLLVHSNMQIFIFKMFGLVGFYMFISVYKSLLVINCNNMSMMWVH